MECEELKMAGNGTLSTANRKLTAARGCGARSAAVTFFSVGSHLHQQCLSPLFDVDELPGFRHSIGAEEVELIVQNDNRVHKVAMSFAIHPPMMRPRRPRVHTRNYPAFQDEASLT